MRPVLALTSFVVVTCLYACGAGDAVRILAPMITDGVEDSGHPQVGLLLIGAEGGTAQTTCTGTLVGPRTVLTAAHCCKVASRNLFELDGALHQVAKVVPHPGWSAADPYLDDIGLAILADAVTLPPLSAGTVAPAAGVAVTLVGFGRTAETAADGHIKRVATNSIAAVQPKYFTTDGTGGGVGNTCLGDSGGPVLIDSGGAEVVVGVISASLSPCGVTSYHVTVAEVVPWLAATSAGDFNSEDTAPPQVQILLPADGATVGTALSLQVAATDDVAVTDVEAFVDDVPAGSLDQPPYAFPLELTPGEHVLRVEARDGFGKAGQAEIGVTAVTGPLPDGAPGADASAGDGGGPDGPRLRGADGCGVVPGGTHPTEALALLALVTLLRLRRRSGRTSDRPPADPAHGEQAGHDALERAVQGAAHGAVAQRM